MPGSSRDRARSLELVIRAAVAEERLLTRRLKSVAEAHGKARTGRQDELRRGHFGHAPTVLGQEGGSSER